MDRLLFGDNQFFGVNHMSEEKARAQAIRFQDTSAILEVLDLAYAEGIRTFMCTTHDRIAEVADHVRRNPDQYPDYRFYPCMPYAHKYANAVTEDGMMGALKRFLPDEGFLNAALRGGKSFATKDIEGIVTLLVDAEMKMFAGLSTPVIFLQNVVVDLLLGLGFDEAFAIFARHVKQRYGAEPGFITMNLPMLLDTLDRVGIDNPIVCANMNKLGFRVSGGTSAYAEALQHRRFRPVAMSVFASGAIPPREALEWVHEQPGIESIVFGASSAGNIRSTARLVEEIWQEPRPVPVAALAQPA
ncbi:hypothetical protein ACFFGH_24850 [Lysobacter korlensis]|uniref:Uroporphyrinogen decarboxylase (URO-D) domain-containing protein n=1 Tax=Lysobacter korlensis TaxID=553636 RepID=A0ABV6RVR0_9GAMM